MSRIGTTVIYTLHEQDVKEIIERRRDIGARIARGNDPRVGQDCAAVIVADWGGSVNLKVLLDGHGDHWATSRTEMTAERLEKAATASPGIPESTLRGSTWRHLDA